MTEQQNNAARERDEIVSRVAHFKATQEKFKREREEYFVTTLQNARGGSEQHVRGTLEDPPLWS
jgi:chorismate mutase